jgi:hypothetical protein
VGLGRRHGNAAGVGVDLHQRVGQGVRVAGDLGAAAVGLELARAGDRHLDQAGGQGRQQGHGDGGDRVGGRPFSSRPPKNIAKLASAEIAPAMVAEIVEIRMSRCFTWASSWAITPRSSRATEHLQDAGGGRHGGVLGVAAGGEGVGLVFVDDVDLGHRQLGPPGQLAHHVVEVGRGLVSSTSCALYMRSTILSENQ